MIVALQYQLFRCWRRYGLLAINLSHVKLPTMSPYVCFRFMLNCVYLLSYSFFLILHLPHVLLFIADIPYSLRGICCLHTESYLHTQPVSAWKEVTRISFFISALQLHALRWGEISMTWFYPPIFICSCHCFKFCHPVLHTCIAVQSIRLYA